jgi:hypothetical protein
MGEELSRLDDETFRNLVVFDGIILLTMLTLGAWFGLWRLYKRFR